MGIKRTCSAISTGTGKIDIADGTITLAVEGVQIITLELCC